MLVMTAGRLSPCHEHVTHREAWHFRCMACLHIRVSMVQRLLQPVHLCPAGLRFILRC